MEGSIDIAPILKRIEHMERELEELKVELLKLQAKQITGEKADKDSLEALERDLEDMIKRRVKTVSGDEAVKILSELIGED